MIDTGDVNNPEDSQLYLKGDTEWKFISDLSGAQGIQGLSAYQVAVQEGFVGTEEEWLQSLKGDKGDKGDQGIQGIQGEKGDPFEYNDFTPEQLEGLKGPKGDTGNTGPQGEPGIAATIEVGETVTLEPGESALVENTGNETNAILKFSLPKGAKGDKGDKGDTGEGLNIKGALDSENDLPADGQPGDAYIIDGNLYVYVGEGGSVVTNPKWSNVGNIKGEKGDQGEQGPQGNPGPQGEPGEPGKDGVSATIEVGTVTSSEPGTQPTVTNVGDSTNAIFNFTIPKGDKGDKGDQGEKGEPGESYSLPIASSDTLGGIKVGAGLEINPDTGVLSATGGGTADSVDWANITSKPDFKTVATTGSYNDLIDKPTIPTKVSELENDSNYLTSVPEEYVTETELAGKNYATVSQIPSLDGYATEAWVGEQGYLTEHQDISNLATKEELASKADSANVYSKSETYTKTETDSAIKQASATVFKYKGAVDNYEGLPTEEVSVGDVYSLRDTNGEYVATKASPEPTWEFLGVEVDLSQYSTTVENDGKYQPKGDYITNSTFTSSLNNKVDKDGDKVLSTNDFTTELKSKLESIEAGAQVNKVTSVAGRTGEVTLTKTDVGLDQVDNTSDLNKPISTAVQGALDSKVDSTAIADMLTKTEASSTYAKKSEIPNTDTFLSKTEASNTYATKTSLNSYLTTSAAASIYQPKGDYLTAVPSEYVTESELEGKGYALKSEIPDDYVLPQSTSSALGGIKIGYTESGKNYPVELNGSGQAYVNVPWTDTNTTYPNATTSSSGLMSSTDKTFLDRYSSYQEISSLSNISATKSVLFLITERSQSLSISSFPTNVNSISIFICNLGSNTITITIPSGGAYVAMNGTSLSISGTRGSNWGEINIAHINDKYLIRIGGVE